MKKFNYFINKINFNYNKYLLKKNLQKKFTKIIYKKNL